MAIANQSHEQPIHQLLLANDDRTYAFSYGVQQCCRLSHIYLSQLKSS